MAIHELSAVAMAAGLRRGELTSVAIVEALQARSEAVDGVVGGYVQRFWDQALVTAGARDAERARGHRCGPLHGLPLSVKDNIDVAGAPTTLGIRSRAQRLATRDAVTVALAREAGAIVVGKSNVPQALVSPMECTNPLYGTTHNPWSLAHGPGGSSGGEGALIASGQSALGLGTDLGGSIRFPATFCGVVGLKPTTHRWSNLGAHPALVGQEVAQAQLGPMARSVADVAMLLRALPGPHHARYDPRVPPLGIGDPVAVELAGLRLGFYADDGFVTPATPCQRALRQALAALEAAGVELVELPPADQQGAVQLYVGAVSSDGMHTLRRILAGEPIAGPLRLMWRVGHLPAATRRLAARLLPWLGQRRLAAVLDVIGAKPVERLWELTHERNALARAELDAWRAAGVQAVVCPATVTPAVPIGRSEGLSLVFGPFGRYNLCGFPAGVVPVTTVRADETGGRVVRDRLDRRLADVEARSAGLPVAVQVVGWPWREDLVLSVMAAIERDARGRRGFPRTPVEPRRQLPGVAAAASVTNGVARTGGADGA